MRLTFFSHPILSCGACKGHGVIAAAQGILILLLGIFDCHRLLIQVAGTTCRILENAHSYGSQIPDSKLWITNKNGPNVTITECSLPVSLTHEWMHSIFCSWCQAWYLYHLLNSCHSRAPLWPSRHSVNPSQQMRSTTLLLIRLV